MDYGFYAGSYAGGASSAPPQPVQYHPHHAASSPTAVAVENRPFIAPTENATQLVYTPNFSTVLSIPTMDVLQLPHPSHDVRRYVLCDTFDPARPESSCRMGRRCKFVHANTARARHHQVHVNYAWRQAEDVVYPRFEAGVVYRVASPNSNVTTDLISSELMLKTRVLESARHMLSHCAHYYYNRTCNLGADCHFVHAVYIDRNAKDHQRAPVPTQMGRSITQHHGHDVVSRFRGQGVRSSYPPMGTGAH